MREYITSNINHRCAISSLTKHYPAEKMADVYKNWPIKLYKNGKTSVNLPIYLHISLHDYTKQKINNTN